LLADRVVPWSKITESLAPGPAGARHERFESEDIGLFGFPRREVSSILRHLAPDGQWQGTAFLVAPDVAPASNLGRKLGIGGQAQGPGYVEYVISPYVAGGVKFQRVAIKEVVPLIVAEPAGVVALPLEREIPGASSTRAPPDIHNSASLKPTS
jgi:hypothetical protein